MAKKHASDRKPYSPVDAAFMRSLPTVFASAPVEPQAHDVAVEVQQENIIAHAAPPTMEAEAMPSHGVPLSTAERPKDVSLEVELQPKTLKPERLTKYLKFQVSHAEQLDIMRVVHRFAGELSTSVDWSHVARAIMLLLRHAEQEILKHARRNGPLVRPPNYDAPALAEFEHAIAQIFMRAFQEADPLR